MNTADFHDLLLFDVGWYLLTDDKQTLSESVRHSSQFSVIMNSQPVHAYKGYYVLYILH